MNPTLDIRFKFDGGDPAEEAKVRSIVADEPRKLAPAIVDRIEAAGIEATIRRRARDARLGRPSTPVTRG